MSKEKFPQEEIEKAKSQLRVEESASEAESCPECAKARAESGDETYLCPEHLKWVLLGGKR
jgi:hypothetical protein